MNKREPNLYIENKDCSGCSACVAVCPVQAIEFEYNNEGFLYPIVNKEKCIKCLKCESVCAFKKDHEKPICEKANSQIYAAKVKDADVLLNSSSGGIFTAISDVFLKKNNKIFCCSYSYCDDAVLFSFVDDKCSRDKARGSKYIQAEVKDDFIKLIKWLIDNPNREVLIIGTGCQIAGLDLVLKEKKLRDRVLLVDLICHGVTSPKLWKDYISIIKKENEANVDYLTFKDKRNGWESPSVFVRLNHKELSIKPFADWFYMGWTIRESCYNCPYTRIDRNSDITIGDFWGIQNVMPDFYDKNGVSLVITHNEKGERIFSEIKEKLYYRDSNRKDCMQPRLQAPSKVPKDRKQFWEDINQFGIEFCETKYFQYHKISLKQKMKRIIRKILKK